MLHVPSHVSPHTPSGGLPLLDELLATQQSLTAVEQFSTWHAAAEPAQSKYYRHLLPLAEPGPGEQYAFEVDLDACSGCKACVAACHSLNGLEENEMWRSVGLLLGGNNELPVLQHVTTACHHCLEPACLDGCPVEAYEKDPVTGIVRHLDDQCIGCQYCILKCPYDVPKYSAAKGIVRKCDMCRGRLAVGEAPACVQACPHEAIRIRVVSTQETLENAEANLFLPGAPEPGYTLPSTVYKTKKPLPANLLPADYYRAAPQHAHWPLVFMLVLTQMSVGAFLVEQSLARAALAAGSELSELAQVVHSLTAFGLGMLGLAASVFHLGRPWLAYRAVLAWRTSWLSREALAFGAFAALASLYATLPWLPWANEPAKRSLAYGLGLAVSISGLLGVACSAMIYASTRRALWNFSYSGLKFLLTCGVLGIPVALVPHALVAVQYGGRSFEPSFPATCQTLCGALMGLAVVKLAAELAIFCWLHTRNMNPLRRTALLLTGELVRPTQWRFALGSLGGLVAPAFLLAYLSAAPLEASPAVVMPLLTLLFAASLAGELFERYLFFAAVVAPKMPGVPAS